jgi:hypothetical protein
MDWIVLLPIVVSAGVILLLYTVPPPWVKRYMGAADDLKQLLSPTALGDAVHHAVTKNDAEVLTIVGEEMNGIVHEAIPVATERLANEAVGLLASMYTKGVAKDMGERSGAARGYLKLPGIQKQALKTGAESLLGGGLGELLGGVDISPEMIQMFMSSMAGGRNNGPGAVSNMGQPPSPNQQLPQLGSPV